MRSSDDPRSPLEAAIVAASLSHEPAPTTEAVPELRVHPAASGKFDAISASAAPSRLAVLRARLAELEDTTRELHAVLADVQSRIFSASQRR